MEEKGEEWGEEGARTEVVDTFRKLLVESKMHLSRIINGILGKNDEITVSME